MQTIDDYLDAARTVLDVPSDRQLALLIGITPQTLNGWRTKRAWPADAQMVRLAQLAGADPETALIDLNIWRAKDATARDLYRRLQARLATVGTALILTLLLGFWTGPARAGTPGERINLDPSPAIHYARFDSGVPALRLGYLLRLSRLGPLALVRFSCEPPTHVRPIKPTGHFGNSRHENVARDTLEATAGTAALLGGNRWNETKCRSAVNGSAIDRFLQPIVYDGFYAFRSRQGAMRHPRRHG